MIRNAPIDQVSLVLLACHAVCDSLQSTPRMLSTTSTFSEWKIDALRFSLVGWVGEGDWPGWDGWDILGRDGVRWDGMG